MASAHVKLALRMGKQTSGACHSSLWYDRRSGMSAVVLVNAWHDATHQLQLISPTTRFPSHAGALEQVTTVPTNS